MMEFKSKYKFEDLVEYDPPTAQESGFAYGFIRAVRFRKYDAANHVTEYTIERCNSSLIDADVRESEVKRVFR